MKVVIEGTPIPKVHCLRDAKHLDEERFQLLEKALAEGGKRIVNRMAIPAR